LPFIGEIEDGRVPYAGDGCSDILCRQDFNALNKLAGVEENIHAMREKFLIERRNLFSQVLERYSAGHESQSATPSRPSKKHGFFSPAPTSPANVATHAQSQGHAHGVPSKRKDISSPLHAEPLRKWLDFKTTPSKFKSHAKDFQPAAADQQHENVIDSDQYDQENLKPNERPAIIAKVGLS
jgi:hypothetical protein